MKIKLKELKDACIALDAVRDSTGDDDFDVVAAYDAYIYDASCNAFGDASYEVAGYDDAVGSAAIQAAAEAMEAAEEAFAQALAQARARARARGLIKE